MPLHRPSSTIEELVSSDSYKHASSFEYTTLDPEEVARCRATELVSTSNQLLSGTIWCTHFLFVFEIIDL